MQSAFVFFRGVCELKHPELDCSLGEGCMQVKAMVAAFVVMKVSSNGGIVSFVPNVSQFVHGLRLNLVEPVKEILVDCLAVVSDAAFVNPHGGNQEAFVACHQIGKVAEGFRRVAGFPYVYMDSASVERIAFRSPVPEPPNEFLQGFDVLVVEDGRYQFRPLAVVPCYDAPVPLEFPLAPLSVPCAPSAVPVAACCVLEPSRSEELGGNLSCLAAADVVHLDLHPDGLVLHVLNLLCCALFHFRVPLSFNHCVFPTLLITLM